MKNSVKRKGFTLVELLIVIVVIGILSAMMMMSSTEAVTSAKASNIVSNLRNLKTAALALYTDSLDTFSDLTNKPDKKSVFQYLTSGTNIPDSEDYYIVVSTQTGVQGSWFLLYNVEGYGAATDDDVVRIKSKLKGRAKSVGLLNATADTGPMDYTTEYTDGKYVAVYVR